MSRERTAIALLAAMAALACDPDGEAPFGGPHGGSVPHQPPTDGGYDSVDATFTVPRPVVSGNVPGELNSWTHIFYLYLDTGTIGDCTTCHKEMRDPPAAFRWLEEMAYVGDNDPPLVSFGLSCLAWYGGNMPPGMTGGGEAAVVEMDAWAKAGARNN